MSITIEQAQVGVKVKIPTQKTLGPQTYMEFNRERLDHFPEASYMILGKAYTDKWATVYHNTLVYHFALEDLDLYEFVQGTKVQIPKGDPQSNNFWGVLRDFNYQLPYVVVGEITKGGYVKLLMDNSVKDFGANLFKPSDLDIYEPEQINPTSYPLPNDVVSEVYKVLTPEDPQPKGPQGRKVGTLTGTYIPTDPEEVMWEPSEKENILAKVKERYQANQVVKPAHYNSTTITALEVIDSWEANFRVGNALKYLARYQLKGKPVEDLQKAVEYLKLEITRLQTHVQ